ncbi:Poly [ADP-ribose] polymerase 1 [Rhynchospora pubera]|uniref:Poly [ADP-ribose] polymerase 1 n=1 Tax=Rhynchospora pubera TaxID=906938 RepID=A0AAV8ER52_9POAL|nr:Poly [ADP-ribose] polymerase 1 [Rhynchospora pubera]
MAPTKVVAEYAKSGRSTCKGCQKAIGSGTLRVGSSGKGPGGFDMTKWYHLDCFPTESNPIGSVEDIKGVASLKSADKEALRSLEAGASSSEDKKRDCGSASPSNDSQMKKKLKVPAGTKDGEVKFSDAAIKDKYKDATLTPNWKNFQTVIFNVKGDDLHDSTKIAAFDFDGCLARTNVRITGANAWSLMYPNIPKKLQGLYNDGYKLVIFTNESNIERWKNTRQKAVDSKIGRLENFIKRVEVPIQVFIACGIGDLFRKPSTGMWTLLKEHFNSGVAIDMHQSFYVGDAAGREKDHSDADIEFAKAIGLKFYVPEVYFDVK